MKSVSVNQEQETLYVLQNSRLMQQIAGSIKTHAQASLNLECYKI